MKAKGNVGFALKSDIQHYFDDIDNEILLQIIERKIKDKDVIGLIKTIFKNHKTDVPGKGMPLGNLTSQFFANLYLNELAQGKGLISIHSKIKLCRVRRRYR